MTWLSFLIGVWVGATFAVFILGLMAAARDDRDQPPPKWEREERLEWTWTPDQ